MTIFLFVNWLDDIKSVGRLVDIIVHLDILCQCSDVSNERAFFFADWK